MDPPGTVVNSRVEGEDQPEKKSMLTKVKAKAKKLKHSMKGQHHGQEQEGHQNPDDNDMDEDDDEVDEPDVHGAPKYDDPVVRKTDIPAQGDFNKGPMRTFGETKAGHDEYDPGHKSEDLLGGARTKQAVPTSGPLQTPQNTPVSSRPHHEGEDSPLPKSTPATGTHKDAMDVDPKQTFVSGQGGVNLDRPRGLEEDTHAPKATSHHPSNYEAKVNDPTKSGGGEAGVTPLLHSLDKMNIHGDDRQNLNSGAKQNPATGSHDQFSPDKPTNQGSSYTSSIVDKAMLAKNAVASKLGYGQSEQAHDSGDVTRTHEQPRTTPTDQQGKPITSTMYEKVVGAGTAVKTKIPGMSSATGQKTSEQVHDSGDVTRTNEQPRTTPTDKQGKPITSTMYEKVVGAGTAVTSKIPGMSSATGRETSEQVHDSGNVTGTNEQPRGPRTTPTDQQGKPITSTMYEKVAGAGTAVMSKIPGMSSASTGRETSEQVHDSGNVTHTSEQPRTTATDQQGKPITSTMYQKVAGAGSAVMSKIPGMSSAGSPKAEGQTGQNKGVKDSFAEKLRPGEEDKALSEVISEKFQMRKPGVKDQTGHSGGASPKGKVTESEEVKQRLGDTGGNDNYMTEKVKDSVGSMLGRTNENDEDAQRAKATAEHRRLLQESGN